MAKDRFHIGIDLGGTNIQAGVLAPDGKLVARESAKTRGEQGADAVVQRIADLVDQLLKKRKISRGDVGALGIGAPGAIDHDTGVVMTAVNLRWNAVPLADMLSEATKLTVFVDNDVNVGAWGEFRAGAGRGFQDLMAVFIGTGIGGGLILGGNLYHGHFRTAGEIGHTVVRASGGLGRRTLENLASRTAIVNLLQALIQSNSPSVIPGLVDGDLTKVRSKVLAQAYAEQDPLTRQVVGEAAELVGVAVANVVTLLSLPCVVIGGGLAEAIGESLIDPIRAAFNRTAFPVELHACKILLSELGDDAGVIGAAMLARDRSGG